MILPLKCARLLKINNSLPSGYCIGDIVEYDNRYFFIKELFVNNKINIQGTSLRGKSAFESKVVNKGCLRLVYRPDYLKRLVGIAGKTGYIVPFRGKEGLCNLSIIGETKDGNLIMSGKELPYQVEVTSQQFMNIWGNSLKDFRKLYENELRGLILRMQSLLKS